MTQVEFLAYAQLPLNITHANVWYSTTSPYTILGITIPTITFTGQDITSNLNQVQQISLPGQIAGSNVELTLNVNTRQLYSTNNGNFYFYTVTPDQTGNITTPVIFSGQLVFSPSIDSNVFNDSPYNVLHGSIEQSRKSEHIMFSDRYTVGTLALPNYTGPTNIDALLSGSASKADVQDSLYSNTGWINARYTGTKTNIDDYQIDSAATGKVIKASEYPISYSISDIQYQQSSSQVIYSDYFYSGIGDVPGFDSPQLAITVSGSNSHPEYGYLYIKGTTTSFPIPPDQLPKPGDVLAVDGDSSLPLAQNFNTFIVMEVSLYTTTPQYSYRIQCGSPYPYRGSSQLTPIALSNDNRIYKIKPSKIYALKRNELAGVQRGKLLIKDTGKIVTLNEYGYVIAST